MQSCKTPELLTFLTRKVTVQNTHYMHRIICCRNFDKYIPKFVSYGTLVTGHHSLFACSNSSNQVIGNLAPQLYECI